MSHNRSGVTTSTTSESQNAAGASVSSAQAAKADTRKTVVFNADLKAKIEKRHKLLAPLSKIPELKLFDYVNLVLHQIVADNFLVADKNNDEAHGLGRILGDCIHRGGFKLNGIDFLGLAQTSDDEREKMTAEKLKVHLVDQLGEAGADQFIKVFNQSISGSPSSVLTMGIMDSIETGIILQADKYSIDLYMEQDKLVIDMEYKIRAQVTKNLSTNQNEAIPVPLRAIMKVEKSSDNQYQLRLDTIYCDSEAMRLILQGQQCSVLAFFEDAFPNSQILDEYYYDFAKSELTAIVGTLDKKSPLRVMAENVLQSVEAASLIPEKTDKANKAKRKGLGDVLKSTSRFIQSPYKQQTQDALLDASSNIIKYKGGRRVAGAALALFGLGVMATSTMLALVSFGVLSPVSAAGLTVGASLVVGAVAAGAGGSAGLAAVIGGVVGANSFFASAKKAKLVKKVDALFDAVVMKGKR